MRLPLMAYSAAAALDLESACNMLQHDGLHEYNPTARWTGATRRGLKRSPVPLPSTPVVRHQHLIGRKHQRLTKVALYSAAAFRIGLAARNHRITEGQVQRQSQTESEVVAQ
jgi:hypothetical protein